MPRSLIHKSSNSRENNENVREDVWIIAFMKQSMVLRPQRDAASSIHTTQREWLHAGKASPLYSAFSRPFLLSQTLPSTLKFIEFIVVSETRIAFNCSENVDIRNSIKPALQKYTKSVLTLVYTQRLPLARNSIYRIVI